MALDGITRRISVPQCGTAGLTPTVWELDSPTPPLPDGASGSATDMATIPGITRGGDRWDITDMAGIPITAGEPGVVRRSPTFTACGAIRLTHAPGQPGQILIPAITEQRRAAPTTTPRPAGRTVAGRGTNTNIYTGNTAGYRGGATYNPNTGIVAGGGAGYAGNIYSGQGTAGRGGFAYNTNTNAGVAARKNNVYAGKDGTVYRYNRQNGDWSSNSGNGWQTTNQTRCQPPTSAADAHTRSAANTELQLDRAVTEAAALAWVAAEGDSHVGAQRSGSRKSSLNAKGPA